MPRFSSANLLFWAVSLAAGLPLPAAQAAGLRVATFSADVTPPVGQPLVSGDLLKRVEDPLLAKGIVIEDGPARYVLCAVDWCELCNSSHALFRRKIAEAAGTCVSRVAVAALHQHTAPVADGDAEKLLTAAPKPPAVLGAKTVEALADRLAAAVRRSTACLEPFDQVGVGEAKVDRVASSRRVKGAHGKIRVRWSTCKEADLRAMPEGLIDPLLKTVTLARSGKPLVRLHYYATHPQTPYGDGRASADVPGWARQRRERKEGVFQVYFDGCGGDITLGKYNDGTPSAREGLARRLEAGMQAAAAATRFAPAAHVGWRVVPVAFAPRNDPGYTEADGRARLLNPAADYGTRTYRGAMVVAFRHREGVPFELTALAIGPARILHLPGEAFIDFQLYAQRVAPRAFVAVAAYGDCATGYICTQKAFAEGGYEPTDSMVAPQSESVLRSAIRKLLADER
jgi:hypothetical protein